MNDAIRFVVYGKPAQMGSKKAFVRGGRAIITDDNSVKRKQWANAVASVAAETMAGRDLLTGPVWLHASFYFARPKSHFGTGKNASVLKDGAPGEHAQTPDLDKLLRCLNDALTGVVFRDDSLVSRVYCRRVWTIEQERCEIEIVNV